MLRAIPEPSPRLISNLGISAARSGDLALADSMLQRLVPRPGGPAFARLYRARILAHLDRPREAVAELEMAIESGLMAAEVLHPDFGLAPLSGFRGFERLFEPR